VTKVTRLAQQKCCRDLLFRNHERLFATQKDQRIVGASVLVAHKGRENASRPLAIAEITVPAPTSLPPNHVAEIRRARTSPSRIDLPHR
jgi:hypothetical protein